MRIIWSSCLFDFWQGALSCLEETGSWASPARQQVCLGGGSSFSKGAAVTVRAAEALVVADQIDGAISWV